MREPRFLRLACRRKGPQTRPFSLVHTSGVALNDPDP